MEAAGVTSWETAGWEPTCDCGIEEVVPATVLDPFSGSATTGEVALGLGRNYLGLDLGEGYLSLALDRLQGARQNVETAGYAFEALLTREDLGI